MIILIGVVFFFSILTYLILRREESIILNLYKEKAVEISSLVAEDLIFMMIQKDPNIVINNIEAFNKKGDLIIGVAGANGSPAFNTNIPVPVEIFSAQKESYVTSDTEFIFFKPLQNNKECHACHSPVDKTRGMIVIKTPFLEAKNEIRKTAKRLLFFAIFMGLATEILLITILKKTVLDPLNKLTEGAETLKTGKLDHRIDIKSNNEIGSLALCFNDMAESIEKSHLNLEKVVRKKTKEMRVIAGLSGKMFKGNFMLDDIINESLDVIISELDFDYAALCLVDKERGVLSHEYRKGILKDFCPAEQSLTSDHPLIKIMREARPKVRKAVDLGAPDDFGNMVIIPLLSRHMKRCREINRCNKKSCPAFEGEEERCWLINDTLCRSPQAVAGKEKIFGCLHCDVFPVLGTLIAGKKQEISKSSLHSLEILVSEIISAIENNNFMAGKKQDIDNLIKLHDTSIKTLQNLNYRELIGSIASSAVLFGNTDASILWLLKQDGFLHIEGVSNIDRELLPDTLPLDELFTVRSQTDDRLTESIRCEDFVRLRDLFAHYGFLYSAVVPLKQRDSIFGFLMLLKKKDFFMTESEKAIISLFASQAASAIQTANIYSDLLSQKEFSETIFNNINSGIIVLDKDGIVLKINKRALNILKIKLSDTSGKKLADVFPGAEVMLSVDDNLNNEVVITSPDKKESIPVGFTNSFLFDQSHNEKVIIVLFRDLTEIKKLQEELRKKQHFAAMGTVVAGVAHEIRNPLFGISSIVQILEREVKSEKHRFLLNAMLREIYRVKNLIEELLLYSRPSKLDIIDIDLSILADNIEHYIRAKKTNIVFNLELQPRTSINGDLDKITQVFLNLVDNSIGAGSKKITIRSEKIKGATVITVEDDGAGIKGENIDKVFDPFFTTKKEGTGLGLSICRKIIEDHGGDIAINSADGTGTTVTITFKES